MNRKHAEVVGSGDHEITVRSVGEKYSLVLEAEQKGVDTVEKMFNFLHDKYSSRPCIGTREIFSTEEEKSANGKVLKKYNMGDYKWMTYNEMYNRAVKFGKGVAELGYTAGTKVVMYADTRGKFNK